MKNRGATLWMALIASGCVLHLASSVAWAGLDYYLVVTNHTSALSVTASRNSGASLCINAVEAFPPIPPNGSQEYQISTDGSDLGGCGTNNHAMMVEEFTIKDTTGTVVTTASMNLSMDTNEESPHCVAYTNLSFQSQLCPARTRREHDRAGSDLADGVLHSAHPHRCV